MPSINKKHYYHYSRTLLSPSERANSLSTAHNANSIDLAAPTLPIPQVHPHQLNNQDIVLITLTAILILVSGMGIVRLVQIKLLKFALASSSTTPLPQVTAPVTLPFHSAFAGDDLEKDITFAFSYQRPETPPSSPKQLPSFQAEEEADIATMLSLRAGIECASRRGHRDKMESASSQTTTTTVLETLCSSESVLQTSVTSMYSMSTASLWDDEQEEEEEVVYEVKRAQTQSIEVKKGVLVSWRSSRPSSSVPDMPTIVISESVSLSGSEMSSSGKDDGLLHAELPSLVVTHPSCASFYSFTSSVSVDLDEFPLPPTLNLGIQPSILPNLLGEPDSKTLMSQRDKRSTVDQVITLYE